MDISPHASLTSFQDDTLVVHILSFCFLFASELFTWFSRFRFICLLLSERVWPAKYQSQQDVFLANKDQNYFVTTNGGKKQRITMRKQLTFSPFLGYHRSHQSRNQTRDHLLHWHHSCLQHTQAAGTDGSSSIILEYSNKNGIHHLQDRSC